MWIPTVCRRRGLSERESEIESIAYSISLYIVYSISYLQVSPEVRYERCQLLVRPAKWRRYACRQALCVRHEESVVDECAAVTTATDGSRSVCASISTTGTSRDEALVDEIRIEHTATGDCDRGFASPRLRLLFLLLLLRLLFFLLLLFFVLSPLRIQQF
jgi:hypothetical protein